LSTKKRSNKIKTPFHKLTLCRGKSEPTTSGKGKKKKGRQPRNVGYLSWGDRRPSSGGGSESGKKKKKKPTRQKGKWRKNTHITRVALTLLKPAACERQTLLEKQSGPHWTKKGKAVRRKGNGLTYDGTPLV